MVLETILSSELAVRVVYPFLLVFVLLFAILEKSKILGDEKHQINSIIALVIGLITIAFSWATDVIINLMPFLAISSVVLLVFLILYGFIASTNKDGLVLNKNLKTALGVLAGIVVVIALIVATGQWSKVYNWMFVDYGSGPIWGNILLVAVSLGALVLVWTSGKNKKSGE
ncbi:hypothetical protein COU56_01645 [Candidatus Pacearchaeota archaeon CG10_big_fil_rev_8_21_14_0_10_31_9]|nr:MAG: hypothetical protein AUJ62_01055 [Candidatus Pacearchaeota archaeon CG1_02_32_21]PIN95434.1 MAG: hypothetical protein COU56_01645 [Candidatus Pacearchaeota archaeon CG10_big_fil_rev_8_21_14_0_10_31_9]PIZ82448.1 MAG: hypothetical protein COX97_04800 [Candidatus Pacearchaeota archaeon CG_4_10_14_0_2_um_filter_05_32_18]